MLPREKRIDDPDPLWFVPDSMIDSDLSPQVLFAWSWLYTRGGRRPCTISFTYADLAARFKRTPRAASMWCESLVAAGLMRIWETKRGRRGGVEASLFDPDDVSRARVDPDSRPPAPANKVLFDLHVEVEEEPPAPIVAFGKPEACAPNPPVLMAPEEVKPEVCAHKPPVIDKACCAPGNVDTLAALVAEIESELGADTCQAWLDQGCLNLEGNVLTIFAENNFCRDHLANTYGRQVRGRILQIDQSLTVVFETRPPTTGVGAPGNQEGCAHKPPVYTAQQLTTVCSKESLKDSLEQTQQPNARDSSQIVPTAWRILETTQDESIFFWVGITATIALWGGWVSREELYDMRADLNVALKEKLGRNWMTPKKLRPWCKAQGIAWQRRWEKPWGKLKAVR